ncbi:MAG: hypothetical protein R3330_14900, partial [Saprospiraceae bacterium]|nr:hypothetical protein [Saprospiraceae bacterium]
YHLPGTIGWDTFVLSSWGELLPWDPEIQTSDPSFGVQSDQFGFNITASSDLLVVVEATDTASLFNWSPVGTNQLAAGSSYFSDPDWMDYPCRIYRLRLP